MKLVAHRGWSAGPGENTLAAIRRAAATPEVAGVEIDVRRGAGGALVLAHDPPVGGEPTLEEALKLLAGTALEAYVEVKERGIAAEAARALAERGLGARSVVFGFPGAMEPWRGERSVRMGMIAPLPWDIPRLAALHRPDVLLLGWDDRPWTRRAFQLWWGAASLRRAGARHGAAVVAGVAQRREDLRWLERQGVEAATADMDRL